MSAVVKVRDFVKRPQNEEHVDAAEGRDEDDEVRDGLPDVVLEVAEVCRLVADHVDDEQRDERRRQSDEEVRLELVFHLDALGLGGRDGRVGNEGQVVTEHGAAEDDARTVGDTESGALREGDGDRDEDRDRADTGAHGHGDEGRDDEHAGDRHASGQELEQEVRGAGRAAGCLRDAAEHAGEQEDEDHDGDVVIADALRAEVDLLIEGPLPVLGHGGDPRDGEREDDRHDGETHLPVTARGRPGWAGAPCRWPSVCLL